METFKSLVYSFSFFILTNTCTRNRKKALSLVWQSIVPPAEALTHWHTLYLAVYFVSPNSEGALRRFQEDSDLGFHLHGSYHQCPHSVPHSLRCALSYFKFPFCSAYWKQMKERAKKFHCFLYCDEWWTTSWFCWYKELLASEKILGVLLYLQCIFLLLICSIFTCCLHEGTGIISKKKEARYILIALSLDILKDIRNASVRINRTWTHLRIRGCIRFIFVSPFSFPRPSSISLVCWKSLGATSCWFEKKCTQSHSDITMHSSQCLLSVLRYSDESHYINA